MFFFRKPQDKKDSATRPQPINQASEDPNAGSETCAICGPHAGGIDIWLGICGIWWTWDIFILRNSGKHVWWRGWVLGTLWRIFLLKSPSWSVISGELKKLKKTNPAVYITKLTLESLRTPYFANLLNGKILQVTGGQETVKVSWLVNLSPPRNKNGLITPH